ncbi:uncharacterized protein [Drosophila bipectinata]|uniref:uncharacterized protein n=1 Tax=Drosophila bipectinata TaxID=42026 RepID=UPI0007E68E0C
MSDSQPYNDIGLMSGASANNFIHDQHYVDHQSSTAKAAVVNNSIMGLSLVPNGISSSDTTDLSQQQMPLQKVPLYLHQHQQRIQKSVDTSSNSSQVGQILEDGCYPEYKH